MITKDGYAAVPWGSRFILLCNGYQLSDHKTYDECIEALKKHRNKTKPTRTGVGKKSKGRLDKHLE